MHNRDTSDLRETRRRNDKTIRDRIKAERLEQADELLMSTPTAADMKATIGANYDVGDHIYPYGVFLLSRHPGVTKTFAQNAFVRYLRDGYLTDAGTAEGNPPAGVRRMYEITELGDETFKAEAIALKYRANRRSQN